MTELPTLFEVCRSVLSVLPNKVKCILNMSRKGYHVAGC